jgi:hypothetical protein
MESQDETKPIKIPYPVGKKPTGLYLTIGILAVIIAVLVFVLLWTGGDREEKSIPPQESPEQHLLTLETAQQRVDEIGKLEADVRQKQNEIARLANNYEEKSGPDAASINVLDLSPGEEEILRQKMSEEGDVSIKSLLEEILDRNNTIRQLKEEIQKIETLLPRPYLVSKGETHFEIAWNFLVKEKGLSPEKANAIIKKTSLFDELVPGFKVWNFYSGREYGTFVTQGTAAISPNEAKARVKKRILATRDKAIKELSKKEKERLNYLKQINSLYYHIDSKKNLVDNGVLKQGFLKSAKLKDISPDDFEHSIDLRKTVEIRIAAVDFDLKRIKRIALFPRHHTEGKDYKIEISEDKQEARLTILDKKKLKNERVVISVE